MPDPPEKAMEEAAALLRELNSTRSILDEVYLQQGPPKPQTLDELSGWLLEEERRNEGQARWYEREGNTVRWTLHKHLAASARLIRSHVDRIGNIQRATTPRTTMPNRPETCPTCGSEERTERWCRLPVEHPIHERGADGSCATPCQDTWHNCPSCGSPDPGERRLVCTQCGRSDESVKLRYATGPFKGGHEWEDGSPCGPVKPCSNDEHHGASG